MIQMRLVGVRVELPANQPIVLLQEVDGERFLPIWIGSFEATAIAFALQGVETPRPMTHDLFKDVLDELTVEIEQVLINDLIEGTFYAMITMYRNGSRHEVSARPSDAIALAVRMEVPIYADENVMDEASIVIETSDDVEIERFRDFLDHVEPKDFL
ncbi:MAG: bifunctional nuclease family protein [Actinobacteria bacterium]|nr:bifunctional nuclease family protein [Actinomycetota bacterium]MCG2796546.1 bifunctional nuclease family protein [Actinomycetes bacterium]MBU4240143.1 bifunctional nuclease family protein [Actinomycetota bacterium]MBU4302699.1 bifunctional nuclease family protein [Actinomycetota bacterium]MBU4385601.1 bifunctional nuclease family protein [Actinomycetota bacterium]